MSFYSLSFLKTCSSQLIQVRHGHRLRGVSPVLAKTLAEKLNPKDGDKELSRRIDIGFPYEKPPRSIEFKTRNEHLRKQKKDFDFEKKARNNMLEINLDEVKSEWLRTGGPFHLRKIAEHYGIYSDLFGKYAYFVPRVHLNIKYFLNDENYCPVYNGNRLEASQAFQMPEVSFDHAFSMSYKEKPEENTLWTLVLTNPDGHMTKDDREYVHWMITNIPKGDVSKGEQIVPYLQPIPFKGTGYHRYVFILYKQNKKLDFSEFKVSDENDLEKRTFYSFDFYKKYQDFMTPAGLSFFQTKWDESVRDILYNKFNMKSPVFEYDFPKAFLKYQKFFPKKQPFNLYLDRYADPKDVNKRYLEQRLAKTHPFDGPEPKLRYPNAHELKKQIPSWYRTEIKKQRLGRGRILDAE